MRRFKLLRRSLLTLAAASLAYLALLVYPQPLFAYELRHAGIVLHARHPIPEAMIATLERVRLRLDRSPIGAAAHDAHVFICESQPLFALFARQNYRVGGVANWPIGGHVFLRESDLQNDRLIGPSGRPVAADRPLSYFIAHELMHIANVRTIGRLGYSQMPQWIDDGYADYVARDIDYGAALAKLKSAARELDPARSGLYLRYHLMVAYLLDKKGMAIGDLLAHPPDRQSVERELMTRDAW
jgi:hypothetical protein